MDRWLVGAGAIVLAWEVFVLLGVCGKLREPRRQVGWPTVPGRVGDISLYHTGYGDDLASGGRVGWHATDEYAVAGRVYRETAPSHKPDAVCKRRPGKAVTVSVSYDPNEPGSATIDPVSRHRAALQGFELAPVAQVLPALVD